MPIFDLKPVLVVLALIYVVTGLFGAIVAPKQSAGVKQPHV